MFFTHEPCFYDIFTLGYFYHYIVVSRCTVLPFLLPFFFVRLFRSPLLVVLFFRTSFSSLFLRCGCFGRLSWLHCSSARFPLYYFASWSFRSPLLVELSFHTLFSLVFVLWLFRSPLLVVLSFHTPFSFFLFFVRCGCFGRLCWLYCSSARSSRIAPLFRLLAFVPRWSLSILSVVLIW